MHSLLFPTTIVDNFLDQPFKYVEFANTLNYKSDEEGKWPGVRTEDLIINYPSVIHKIVKKTLALFYNFQNESISWNVSAYFQKINSNYTKGWIHSDVGSQLTAIIYFCDSGFGTSIYRPKDILNFKGLINQKEKLECYKNIQKINELSNYRDENNNQFEKSITVDSSFNRMMCFQGICAHGADNFISNDNSERLTLIMFISKIVPQISYPIERSKFLL